MIEEGPPLSPEVQVILDRERPIPPLAPAVRARAVMAARAALAVHAVPAPAGRLPAPWLRWAAAAALTIAATGATAAVAYRRHVERLHPISAPAPSSRPVVGRAPIAAAPAAVSAQDALAPVEESRRSKAPVSQEELRLLTQARTAVAREDFNAALRPIAEHARRFRDGRLAEEREALRVKALAGLGRRDEARRAAAAFEDRFPRSVLLPAVRQISPHGG